MSERPRVFISRMIPEKPLALIRASCEVIVWEQEMPPSRPILLEMLASVDGIVSMLTERMDQAALDAAQKLRVISNFAVGYDNVDVAAATLRGIPVGNTPGVLTEATADQAFMLMLAGARRLVESVQYIRDGNWQTWYPLQLLGQDVHGATLGIIGLGRIGHAMAKRGRGFDMRILYHGGSNQEYAQDVGAQAVDLDTLLRESDFVSIHVPLNDSTRRLIGARELALMKASAVLVNTARGGIVDTAALVDALQRGVIACAALDVTDPEPIPPDHPLMKLPNCVIAPHLGSATWKTRERMGMLAAENLLAGLRGERLPYCVNPQVYT